MTTSLQYLPKKMQARKDLDVRPGDTVKVHVKIVEKGKTRTQIFQGLVLARKHGAETGGTITVRKISNGVGVERIFPVYSPAIEKIEVVRRSRVRRAKLYYIRTKVAREIRRKMRNFVDYFATTDDLVIPAEDMEEEIVEPASPEATEGQEEAPSEVQDSSTSSEQASSEEEKAEEIETATEEKEPEAEKEEAPAEEKTEEAGDDKEEA